MRTLCGWRSGPCRSLGVMIAAASMLAASMSTSPLLAQSSEEVELEVTFGDQEVVVEGLAPGSRVAWLSLASEPHRYHVRDVRREGIDSADAGGAVRLHLEVPVPARSVWGFVDLASGASTWASPEGFVLEEGEAGADQVRRDDRGELTRLRARGVGLELLAARPIADPGQESTPGAWAITVFDGGPSDGDGEPDGAVEAAMDAGRPILDSPSPPDRLLPGDVILGIDPDTYRVFTLRMPGGQP